MDNLNSTLIEVTSSTEIARELYKYYNQIPHNKELVSEAIEIVNRVSCIHNDKSLYEVLKILGKEPESYHHVILNVSGYLLYELKSFIDKNIIVAGCTNGCFMTLVDTHSKKTKDKLIDYVSEYVSDEVRMKLLDNDITFRVKEYLVDHSRITQFHMPLINTVYYSVA